MPARPNRLLAPVCALVPALALLGSLIASPPAALADGTTDHQGNGHVRMMLLGETADGHLMASTRYRIAPKAYQDYYFVRGSGSIPTEVRLTNKTGEPVVAFFYNPNDRVRAVARFSRKMGVNGSATAPIGAYYVVVKQDKAFGRTITQGSINHGRVNVFTPRNGGLKNSQPYNSSVTFQNDSDKDVRIFIYNPGDAVRAIAKRHFDVDAGESATWSNADADFRYKLFERRFLDKLMIDGRSTGKSTLRIYKAPTRGYGRVTVFDGIDLDGMPQVQRGLCNVNLDGADIATGKTMYGRLTDGRIVRLAYVTEATTPLRMLGPVKTSWRPQTQERDDWISPFVAPFDQAPSVVGVTIRDFERAAGASGVDITAEIAFGTTPDGRLQWGYASAEDNVVGFGRWRTADEVKWIDAANGAKKKTGFNQGATAVPFPVSDIDATLLAVRDGGDLHIGEFDVKPGVGFGFELEGDGGVFTRWEVVPGDFVGRPAATYWGNRHLYVVARTADGKLMYAERSGQSRRGEYTVGEWTEWVEIAGNAASDPEIYLGGGQLYVAYRNADGRHALVQYDVEKRTVVRRELNHGNQFASGPTLVVTGGN
ncbi:MAG: hypothetical protein AAF288_08310 [Planctomycetota bacterium]